MNDDLIRQILKFRDDRNWKQYHNPKDLAISISIESAELLENFQWSAHTESLENKRSAIYEELADVLIYCILMADSIDADIYKIIKEKLQKNQLKYPIAKSYGKKEKYSDL